MLPITRSIIITVLCSVAFPFSVYATFNDLGSSHINFDAISYLQNEGIVQGFPDGTYKPDNLVNRAEFTKIIISSLIDANDIQGSGEPIFEDVKGNEWFAPYVEMAVKNKILSGYMSSLNGEWNKPDELQKRGRLISNFSPSKPINFAEAAKIMVRAMDIEMKPDDAKGNWWDGNYYKDGHWRGGFYEVGNWWAVYINALLRENVLSFGWKPEGLVTRGQMAEMIYRLKNSTSGDLATLRDSLPEQSTITLYFYSKNDLEQATLNTTSVVERIIPKTTAMADATLKALFAGPTPEQIENGVYTMDELTSLQEFYIGISINEGVATVNFKPDALIYLNASAATQLQAKAAIETNLKQFSSIHSVIYAVEGEIFPIGMPK